MKKKQLVGLLLVVAFLLGLAVPAFGAKEDTHVGTSITIDPSTESSIVFTEEEKTLLPLQVQKYLDKSSRKLSASVATVYVFELRKDNKPKLIKVKKYDFSNKQQLRAYNNDISELDSLNLDIVEPQTQYAYIAVGLDVTPMTYPGYEVAYQNQGWWEWSTEALGAFKAVYDTMGIVWSAPLYNPTDSNYAWADSIFSTATFSPPVKKRNANSGVLWEHTQDYLSTGAVVSKIVYGTRTGTPFEIQFEYNDNEGQTDASGWTTDVVNYIWNYLSMPEPPGATKYVSGASTREF